MKHRNAADKTRPASILWQLACGCPEPQKQSRQIMTELRSEKGRTLFCEAEMPARFLRVVTLLISDIHNSFIRFTKSPLTYVPQGTLALLEIIFLETT
jgi:hypothetical protein